MQTFFPDPVFGWVFYLSLLGLLAVASYNDQRFQLIPKKLTLALLGLGVLFNLVRCAWMGEQGLSAWSLAGGSLWLGLLDGLLFALAGFALGFVLFFVMWILGACGGGDVKLFAAVAAWLGPTFSVMVLLCTILIVMAIVAMRVVFSTITRGRMSAAQLNGQTKYGKPRMRLVWYSLPVALAVALVVGWVCRVDLHLSAPEERRAKGWNSMYRQRTDRRVARRRGGSLTMELLLVLPILMVVILGGFEFSMLGQARQQLLNASRDGARAAALGGTVQTVQQAVQQDLSPQLQNATIQVIATDAAGNPLPSGQPVSVAVSVPANQAVPDLLAFIGFSLKDQLIVGQTVMRKE